MPLRPKPRIRISRLSAADEHDFLAAVAASRALHGRWVGPPDTAAKFQVWLARSLPPAHYLFAVRRREDDALAGVVTLTNVVLGVFRSGYLAYYAFAGCERQGLMRAGVAAVVRHAFGPLRLHRVEANIQPGNAASIALVKSCGFALEGYSPRYLKIAGRWRDHERWARVAR